MASKIAAVPAANGKALKRPSRAEAEAAVRTLIGWAGDDPDREGVRATPGRVVRAFEEYFAGYAEDPQEILGRTFDETDGYDEVVVLKDIRFESHCEHVASWPPPFAKRTDGKTSRPLLTRSCRMRRVPGR